MRKSGDLCRVIEVQYSSNSVPNSRHGIHSATEVVGTRNTRHGVIVMTEKELETKLPSSEEILAAYEKLFDKDSSVRRFKVSGVRYIDLPGNMTLIEQNVKKESSWAKKAREGHKIAWLMKDGDYFALVIDGQVEILHHE